MNVNSVCLGSIENELNKIVVEGIDKILGVSFGEVDQKIDLIEVDLIMSMPLSVAGKSIYSKR